MMTATNIVPSSMNAILKKVGWSVMALLALLLFIVASPYLTRNPEVYFPEQKMVYMAHTAGIVVHVGAAMLAIIIGPFQFLPRSITKRYLRFHRWLGRIYLVSVLISGLAGLYMAQFAYGGLPARLGFALLAISWLFSGLMAYHRIRNKEVQSHRQWMIRNYALTFAGVTLRLWIPIFLAAGYEFAEAYIAIAWLCWVPNLMVAEWMVSRVRPFAKKEK